MQLKGTHHYDHPKELVFRALLDPNVLSQTLPGCEALEQTQDSGYAGKLKMKVGPVQGVFQGKVQLLDIDAPNGYRLELNGSGAPGFMNGSGTLRLEDAEGGTDLHYDIDAKVGGKIASIGQRLVESSAKVITRQGLNGLGAQLDLLAQQGSSTAAPTEDQLPESMAAASDSAPDAAAAAAEPESTVAPPKSEQPVMSEQPAARTSAWALTLLPLLTVAILVAVYLRTCA